MNPYSARVAALDRPSSTADATPTYADDFAGAVSRTERFGLPVPRLAPAPDRLLTPERKRAFPKVIQASLGDLAVDEIVARCVTVHRRAQDAVEQFLGVPVTYTIGHVYTPPVYRFRLSEPELLQLMRSGMQGTEVKLHTWLTLPTMEIIDMVLLTSMAVLNGWSRGQGGVICRHADELLDGVRYHPMLVGTGYLHRIGAFRSLP